VSWSEAERVAYDARWPALADAARAELLSALPGVFVEIEHIGSTSVPGLAAKPIIDLMAAVFGPVRRRGCGPSVAVRRDPPGAERVVRDQSARRRGAAQPGPSARRLPGRPRGPACGSIAERESKAAEERWRREHRLLAG
jgi:hypothetical protein